MTPYERFMAEQWPTGKFGRGEPLVRPLLSPRPEHLPERRQIRPWTPEELAQHLADLKAGVAGWKNEGEVADRKRAYNRDHARATAHLHRHLHLVRGQGQLGDKAA